MDKNFFYIPNDKKIVVELGSGDGNLIKLLSGKNPDCYFIGIELQKELFIKAKNDIKSQNVMLLNFSFEDILPLFEDESIYKIISVLPDPRYIDKNYRKKWEMFYNVVYKKLIKKGLFILVTEITDELFQPVSNNYFYKEVNYLKRTFQSIGFVCINEFEGYQENYITPFLQVFRGDPDRIRIINFEFIKL